MPLRTTSGLVVAARDGAMAVGTVVLQDSDVQSQGSSSGDHYYSGTSRTLSFDLCGGFAQQRVALLSGELFKLESYMDMSNAPVACLAQPTSLLAAGIVLALELNRTMVLPSVVLDGTPAVNTSIALAPFG
jgi:hypothetical protein